MHFFVQHWSIPKTQKTQITPAYMHNILCKNDTNMSNLHKFTQQGAIMEQITNHKTHLHIISLSSHWISKEMTLSQERSTDGKGPYSNKCNMGKKIWEN